MLCADHLSDFFENTADFSFIFVTKPIWRKMFNHASFLSSLHSPFFFLISAKLTTSKNIPRCKSHS